MNTVEGQGSELHVGADAEDTTVVDQTKVTITGRTGANGAGDGAAGEAPEVVERKQYARTLGWRPKDEWAARNPGREHQWRDYEEFISYGENNRPVLITEVRKLSTAITERDRQIRELQESNNELRGFFENTNKAIAERKKADIRARMKAAREANDFDGEMALNDELKALDTAGHTKPREPDRPPPPEVSTFLEANPWYGDGPTADPAMTFEATEVAKGLAARGLKGKPMLDAMLKVMQRRYPDEFARMRGRDDGDPGDEHRGANGNGAGRGSAVDAGGFSGGHASGGRGKAPTFANLPADAQKTALEFERKHKINRESYAKNWFALNGETQ